MPLYDFRCEPCRLTETEFAKYDEVRNCSQCGAAMHRLIGVPRISWLTQGAQKNASPEAIAHFDKIHRDRKAIEDKHYAENGDYGPAAGAD